MASSIEIRRFAPEDEPSVKKLVTGIMTAEFSEDLAAYPTEDIEDIQSSYGNIGEAFFVGVLNGKVIATIGIKKEDDRVALMRRLFVDADHRKKKIGLLMIERALKFCNEVGYAEVVFRTTSKMQSAAKACQKCGFIQRAKLDLGPVELLKFVLSFKHAKSVS